MYGYVLPTNIKYGPTGQQFNDVYIQEYKLLPSAMGISVRKSRTVEAIIGKY